jgi:hypothetical protein
MSAVTEQSDTWFTQDVVVPDQLKLRRYSTASSKSSKDSSTSSLGGHASKVHMDCEMYACYQEFGAAVLLAAGADGR